MNSYILEGGFPRTIQLDNMADKRTYVQGVVREIFEKDIQYRVKIRERETFKAVITYIINNFGEAVSINSLCNALRKNGLSVSRATVTRYLKALTDAKILYECSRFVMKCSIHMCR